MSTANPSNMATAAEYDKHPALRSPYPRPPSSSSQSRRQEPSSDLIFHLISSITSIALPDIAEEPLAAVPDPVARGPAASSTYRSTSRLQRLNSPPPTNARNSLSYRPASAQSAVIAHVVDDAAEPPVIYSSRAQSLRSRQSALELEPRSRSPSLRNFSLSSLSRGFRGAKEDRPSPLKSSWGKAQQQEQIPARTSSLEVATNNRHRQNSVQTGSPNGKERESIRLFVRRPPSRTRNHDAGIEEPDSRNQALPHLRSIFGLADPVRSVAVGAGPLSSGRQSINLDRNAARGDPNHKENEPVTPRGGDDTKLIPERTSSLRQQRNMTPVALQGRFQRADYQNSFAGNQEHIANETLIPHDDLVENDDDDDDDDSGDPFGIKRAQTFANGKIGPRRTGSRDSTISNKAFKVLGISPARSVVTIRGEDASNTLTRNHLDDLESAHQNRVIQGDDLGPVAISAPLQYARPAASVDSSSSRTSISAMSERPPANSLFRSRTPSATQRTTVSRADSRSHRWSNSGEATKRKESQSTIPRHSLHSFRKGSGRSNSVSSIEESVKAILDNVKLSRTIRQPLEKRVISFSDVGDPNGPVVFCCVGMGVTRYISAFHDELAATFGLRIITPDRPGIGGSAPYLEGSRSPISWPDDVQAICQELNIQKFSLLAHSAGAIYALAIALRMPHFIHGKIHLLAPWIPPSQLRLPFTTSAPVGVLPRSQRFLRILPPSFLRLSNSRHLNPASKVPKPPRRSSSRNTNGESTRVSTSTRQDASIDQDRASIGMASPRPSDVVSIISHAMSTDMRAPTPSILDQEQKHTRAYDSYLGASIWAAATTNANPSVSLLVCLEREYSIGFRYADVTVPVVIHHGTEDTRVPIENVRAVAKDMKRVDFRVCQGEGHGLMGNAKVMGAVLAELADGWAGRA